MGTSENLLHDHFAVSFPVCFTVLLRSRTVGTVPECVNRFAIAHRSALPEGETLSCRVSPVKFTIHLTFHPPFRALEAESFALCGVRPKALPLETASL